MIKSHRVKGRKALNFAVQKRGFAMGILWELFLTFARIGMFTFGGGYAMISLIEHECVEKKGWITQDEMMDITVIAESTPGPIAINCATYTGYKKAGMKGAAIATVGMVLPSFFMILLISGLGDDFFRYGYVAKAFKGIRVAVGVLIMQAGITMIRKMMKKTPHKRVSLGFVAVFFVWVMVLRMLRIEFSTIYLIVAAGVLGFCVYSLLEKGEKAGK